MDALAVAKKTSKPVAPAKRSVPINTSAKHVDNVVSILHAGLSVPESPALVQRAHTPCEDDIQLKADGASTGNTYSHFSVSSFARNVWAIRHGVNGQYGGDVIEREADNVAATTMHAGMSVDAEPSVASANVVAEESTQLSRLEGQDDAVLELDVEEDECLPQPALVKGVVHGAQHSAAGIASGGWVSLPMDGERNPNEEAAEQFAHGGEQFGGGGRVAPSDSSALLPASLAAAIIRPVGGDPLTTAMRHVYEARLGSGLDHVRIHRGENAARLTDWLHARAFTYGEHIWLGRGESASDHGLLAHELSHVVQQVPVPFGESAVRASAEDGRRVQAQRSYYALPRLGPGVGGGPGTRTHTYVLDILGHAEEDRGEELFTEVPIPGGASSGSGNTGWADLFKADTRRMIGVKFDRQDLPVFLEIGGRTRHNGSEAPRRTHVRTAAPVGRRGASACNHLGMPRGHGICRMNPGTVPGNIWIGDLKPCYEGQTLLGVGQVDGYIAAVGQLANDVNDYAATHPNRIRPTGATWNPDVGRLSNLAIPQEFAQPSRSSPTVEVALYVDDTQTSIRTMAVPYICSQGSGIWAYDFIPVDEMAPSTSGGTPPDPIDSSNTQLTSVKSDLKQNPRRLSGLRKPGPPSTTAHRIQRTRLRVRDSFRFRDWNTSRYTPWRRNAERATGGANRHALTTPSAAASRRLKAEAARQIRERTGLRAVRVPAGTAGRTRELAHVQHWIDDGRRYGRLRQLFGRAYVRFVGIYDRVKTRVEERVARTRARMQAIRGGSFSLRGAILRGVRVLAATLLGVFIRDVANRLMRSLESGATDVLNTIMRDEIDDVQAQLAEIQQMRQDIETAITDNIEARFGNYIETIQSRLDEVEQAAEGIQGITRLINLVKWAYRIAQCGAPPVVGCLIGLLGSVVVESAAAAIVASCWFQREVLYPMVNTLGPVRRLPGQVAVSIADMLRRELPPNLRPVIGEVDTSDLESRPEDVECPPPGGVYDLDENQRAVAQLLADYPPDHVDALMRALHHLGIAIDDPNPNIEITADQLANLRQLLETYTEAQLEDIIRTTPARPPRQLQLDGAVRDLRGMAGAGGEGAGAVESRTPDPSVPEEDAAAPSEAVRQEEAREVVRRLAGLRPPPRGISRFQPPSVTMGDTVFVFVYRLTEDGIFIGGFEHITFDAERPDGTYEITARGGGRYYTEHGVFYAESLEARMEAWPAEGTGAGGE